MKQVLQKLGGGRTTLADVPTPAASPGTIAIATRCSLISAGTERMLVEFGRAGWLAKVRQQPERVRQVLDKLATDGLLPTIEAVRSKLELPLSLGYSNVGIVIGVGAETMGFAVGDRVVSNGPHAEVVAVPRNLCARVPDSVSDEAAAFAVVGAIALQGIRLLAPTLGEAFVVTGLGLIGLMTVQLLHASGCRVLGIDPNPARTALARQFGATTVDLAKGDDPLLAAEAFSRTRGVDGVLITAATKSNEPVKQAASMCRKRGRIVLVGVAGLELDRSDFYRKELSFQVSCSYGPGRYDPVYEDQGVDYPYGLVRWTEQRNFEAVLDMMSTGTIDVTRLITHRFAFKDAPRAYDVLVTGDVGCLGVLLNYPEADAAQVGARTLQLTQRPEASKTTPVIGVVGAGNYASRVLLPALARAHVQLFGLASDRGISAAHFGRKFGAQEVTTDAAALIADPRINTVIIATRHDTHADFVVQALAAGKHVFVEKPLAITVEELNRIEGIWRSLPVERRPLVMVGFNRRFAPHIIRMQSLLATIKSPKAFVVTVNAGATSPDHWTQDPKVGGGRIIGEGCHFIDIMRFLAAARIERWQVTTASRVGAAGARDDSASITLAFSDGSIGTLHYLAGGHRAFPKERIEVFCAGRVLQLDNFRRLRGYGWRGFNTMKLWRQDKGQRACVAHFVSAVRSGGQPPIPFDELLEVSRVTVALGEAARGW